MKRIIFVLLLLLPFITFAQIRVSGSITLNIPLGLVQCDLKYSNIPVPGTYQLLLNSAFTVKYFKLDNKVLMNVSANNTSGNITYEFYENDDTAHLPSIENLEIVYTGAFPTYFGDEITNSDDMGVIAIKNNILRATSQSVFIPTLIEKTTNLPNWAFMYDLSVHCSDTESVYINGIPPQRGKDLHFTSTQPYGFLLYAGKYNITQQDNLYLLNTTLQPAYVNVIAKSIKSISQFYSRVMGSPYDQSVVMAQIFSIGPPNQYPNWAFTVTPTIVMNLNELSKKIDLKTNSFTDTGRFQTIAHEMAHKYFGGFSSTKNLWHFYNESLAQFLSWKAVENIISPEAYKTLLMKYSFNSRQLNRDFVKFSEIEDTKNIITSSSYDYFPLYMVGFEKIFGEEKCFALLRQIVFNKNKVQLDSNYLKRCAMEIGISESDWNNYSRNILESKNCIPKIMELIK